MRSVTVDLAKSVEQYLKAGLFAQTVAVSRTYLPLSKLVELARPKLTIVPAERVTEMVGRSVNQNEIMVEVAVQKAMANSADVNELDSLIMLTEEVEEFLRKESQGNAAWLKSQNKPIYSHKALSEEGVFSSVLQLTYLVNA